MTAVRCGKSTAFTRSLTRVGSWVATNKDGRVFEFFDSNLLKRLNYGAGWSVEPIAVYLARINTEIKKAP